MAGYKPLYIKGNETGLVQDREEFILPNDAYPVLQNAYVWRERIKRKRGYQLLGRLQRNLISASAGTTSYIAGSFVNGISLFNQLGLLTSQPNANVVLGNISTIKVIIGGTTLTDSTGTGVMTVSGGTITAATINYNNGIILFSASAPSGPVPITVTMGYYPSLPVMGIRTEEVQNSEIDSTIFFDQVYAYKFNSVTNTFQEFIPGTTWNAAGIGINGTDFFWSTNYWIGSPLISTASMPPAYTTAFTTTNKLFWETNGSGHSGALADPPRITDGVTWLDFYHDTNPTVNSPWAQIDAGPTWLTNWLCNLPFRGRMVVFNTWEGINATSSQNFFNRIRWSTIGNPFIPYTNGPPAKGSWRDDIRGQGGFLDIPTSEDIVSVGFVRDNLVIYCERSTWQLRYTGRSIAPFQIEKVNSELGAEGTFSTVQFDTSLVGIGDKGIVECDSYKSNRIDVKIPDFVFRIQATNNGAARIQGIRDFENRLAYFTVPVPSQYDAKITSSFQIYPNVRLVYNYENDSWAIFTDTLTALGTYQVQSSRTWLNTKLPWIKCNFPWIDQPQGQPTIVGGNQQGFVEYLDELTVNDVSLYISNIIGNNLNATVITSPNHNLLTISGNGYGTVIQISGVIGDFANLNGGIFGINVIDANNFTLFIYDPTTGQFSAPQQDPSTNTYTGGGLIALRENFSIVSKKFNFLDDGQNIQMGYLDILLEASEKSAPGAISLYVYLDYDDDNVATTAAANILPNNQFSDVIPATTDTFFNSVIPTIGSSMNGVGGTKFWQRVFCPVRANFLTLQYTFSNAQLAGIEQQQDVQIDSQILWLRRAGRLTQGFN